MLLPKRVRHRMKKKLLKNNLDDNQYNCIQLKELVGSISVLGRWFLDDENVIVLLNNPVKKSKHKYIMIHYRLIEGELVEINRWYHRICYIGSRDIDVIREFNLFMVKGKNGVGTNSQNYYDVIYNYKLDKFIKLGEFIVPKGQGKVKNLKRVRKKDEKPNQSIIKESVNL